MPKTKMLILTFAVSVVLSVIGVASASAMDLWYVNGTELKPAQTAALANTAAVDSPAVLRVPGLSLEITCSGNVLKGSKPEIQGGTAMGQAESVSFESCSEVSPPTCKLSSPKITTESILLLFLLVLPGIPSVTVEPHAGNTFATLTFEGSSCSFEGEQGVTGKVLYVFLGGGSEQVLHAIEGQGTTENNSLILDGNHAYIEGGKTLLKLASGEK